MSASTGEMQEKIAIGQKEEADREERMMKNKANAYVAASGQRSVSPSLLRGLLNGGKDKG